MPPHRRREHRWRKHRGGPRCAAGCTQPSSVSHAKHTRTRNTIAKEWRIDLGLKNILNLNPRIMRHCLDNPRNSLPKYTRLIPMWVTLESFLYVRELYYFSAFANNSSRVGRRQEMCQERRVCYLKDARVPYCRRLPNCVPELISA